MSLLLLFAIISTAWLIDSSGQSELSKSVSSKECQEWVDSVYANLSEEERVGQLVIAHFSPRGGNAIKSQVEKYVVQDAVGGFLLDEGTIEDYAEVINYAQSIAKVPLLVSIDGEWGVAMRVEGMPTYPVNMALGAIRNPQLLKEYGEMVALECKSLGINVNYAPVLDVNSNPKNPVIGRRSYGEMPERVGKLGTAYSLGLEAGGVLSVAKHFPGHGDTDKDSHKTLPTVSRSAHQLDSADLRPFRDYIKAGCGGMMMAHLSVPALDSTLVPSSMSKPIVTGLLKDKMGFNGLVFTDGLGMQGAQAVDGNICVQALKAGNDVLLGPRHIKNDMAAVMQAIANGEISKEQIEKSCKKVLAYKYALGLQHSKPASVAVAKALANSPLSADLNQRLADACITVIRNDDSILPISDLAHKSIAVVNIGSAAGSEFERMCANYAKIDAYQGSKLSASLVSEISSHDVVIAAVYTDGPAQCEQLMMLKNAPGLVVVFMIDPYKMAKFAPYMARAKAVELAYASTSFSQQAAAKGLFGGIDVDGRMPVTVAGIGTAGEGIDLSKSRLGFASPVSVGLNPNLEARVDSAINACLESGAFPGAQVLVARHGDVVLNKGYGFTTKGGVPVTTNTLYDMASVSKTVGTLPSVMKAYDLGLFEMDEPASKHIPGLRVEGKDSITPRMLLYHETGILPSLNLFEIMMDPKTYEGKLLNSKYDKNHKIKIYNGLYGSQTAKMRTDILSDKPNGDMSVPVAKGIYAGPVTYDSIMARIYNSPLCADRNYRYSCLNFSLLMDLEQRVTGLPHYQFVTDSVWAPIGAYNFCYRAAEKYPLSQIAATEIDTYMRKQHVHGYVHDELCAFSGGVQGNAGVFGTTLDVAKLCQTWLNDGHYGDARIFSPATTNLFTDSKSPNSRRGLGFDKPDTEDPDNSPTCDEAGAGVYGHTGYTGTIFWVDPDEDFIFVFLCNRVDPSRNNKAFADANIRPTLMRLIYESLQ